MGPHAMSKLAPVLLLGLTGGIGSGKSTVSALLAERGAVIIDADAITRTLQHSGTPVFDAIVERFGDGVVGADGELDRQALAGIVFADEGAKKDLEHIVHPAVGVQMITMLQEEADTDHVVVYDVPLLVEAGLSERYDVVVIVLASEQVRIDRLAARGMDEVDARSRIAAQASDEQRMAAADVLIQNDGTLDELAGQVTDLWGRLAGA
jgi:dephospho-CoA kinase